MVDNELGKYDDIVRDECCIACGKQDEEQWVDFVNAYSGIIRLCSDCVDDLDKGC